MMKNFCFCFDDIDGLCNDFFTLKEAREALVEYSKKYPEHEFLIYTLSNLFYKNGKEVKYE